MKNVTTLLYGILFTTLFSSPLKAQGWESFVYHPSFDDFTNEFQVIQGPGNGIRILYKRPANPSVTNILNMSGDGTIIGTEIIPSTDNWQLVQYDKTGASYWLSPENNVKKINANNQLEWTYSITAADPNNYFKVERGINGSTYVQYFSPSLGGDIVDLIDKDGVLLHRFLLNSLFDILPAGDMGLIHRAPINGPIATKLDAQGNTDWTRDFLSSEFFWLGTSEGATYFRNSNDELVKLDTAGNIVWVKSLQATSPDIYASIGAMIELSDGNIGVFRRGYYFNSTANVIQISKINAQTGELIWEKKMNSVLNFVFQTLGFFEMPDGGLVAAIETMVFMNSNILPNVFILRTDVNGNTLTNTISGNVFQDNNDDCSLQNTEEPMLPMSIIAQSNSFTYSATTDTLGNYNIPVSLGTYELSYGQLGSYWEACAIPNVDLLATNQAATVDIGIEPLADCPELVVSLGSNVFRRCFDNNYLQIHYKNIGTAPAENAYINLFMPPDLEFLSAGPITSVPINSQNFRFELGTLDVGEKGQISVNFKVNCDATMGELVCASASIYPDLICLPTTPDRTDSRFCLPIVASFDPNDKTAFMDGEPVSTTVAPEADLEYLIRFQNTGNDTAFNIVILDTLTTLLDPASVQPGASSHPYTFELIKGHILRFSFRNILLPDSTTNEVASHGFVKFMVHQSATNVIGNEIKNSAAIYFDYNAPIITNETKLVIALPSATAEAKSPVIAQVFPVPARDRAQVTLLNTNGAAVLWRLFDITGKLVASGQATNTGSFDIPRNNLPAGMYHCQFLMDKGQMADGKIMFE